MTAYAEVIGDPIRQSKSPLIHTFWIGKLGLDADYRAEHVTAERLEAYLAERRNDPDWRGCNVTMPHKQTIMPLLDRLEPLARRVGAVNTVIKAQDGRLVGRNTDVAGFLEPLAERLAGQHYFRMARILGTGGAALDHFAAPTDFAFDDREGCCDLVINASPLGMRGQPPLPFDWSHAPPGSIAYDIVTDPLDTPFLRDAQAAGHETIDGYAMLIGQAAAAFTHFFGAEPPREKDAELRERLLA